MLRSRDLVIFLGIIVCLSIGIAYTYITDTNMPTFEGTKVFFNTDSSNANVFTAISSEKKVDRGANINRLRALLASNTEVLTSSLSVESEPQVAESPVAVAVLEKNVALLKCPGMDDGVIYIQQWPVSDTTIVVKDGMRSVVHIVKEMVLPTSSVEATTTASSSVVLMPSVSPKTLLLMPMYPSKVATARCVQSEVVGVTLTGALLSNSDAHFYRSSDSSELIGYARDGFPVYGAYGGEVDSCGGYMHPEGYRYTISKDRNFILGCYVGAPAVFTL